MKQSMKDLVRELKNQNITVKRQKYLQEKISKRVEGIWYFICEKANSHIGWWSYSNDYKALLDEWDGDTDGGYFDPTAYKDFVKIIGEWDESDCFGPYKNGFPTKLLYDENWKETISREFEKEQPSQEKIKHYIQKIKKLPPKVLEEIVEDYC